MEGDADFVQLDEDGRAKLRAAADNIPVIRVEVAEYFQRQPYSDACKLAVTMKSKKRCEPTQMRAAMLNYFMEWEKSNYETPPACCNTSGVISVFVGDVDLPEKK